ncbi:hypothetical protein ACFQZ4_17440 [Catellatospora coxensis]|uniref:hypothetical protein n=1 Tax=Catellatospora coxensis TaxID=310354 RepID=UPI001EF1FD70|nr:hypothetical protein [Catellatospora coxensis]
MLSDAIKTVSELLNSVVEQSRSSSTTVLKEPEVVAIERVVLGEPLDAVLDPSVFLHKKAMDVVQRDRSAPVLPAGMRKGLVVRVSCAKDPAAP